MASPPILPIEKQHPSVASSASVTCVESQPRDSKSVLQEESIAQKSDKKLTADDHQMSSRGSGQVTSFTCNPVFKFANSKLATGSNGLQHTSNSMLSDILPANGSINSASVSAQDSFTRGSFTISSSCTGSLSTSFATPSLASSGAGSSSSAPFSFFPQFGTASSSDKSKGISSSSTPFNISQQFGTGSSFAAQDKSKLPLQYQIHHQQHQQELRQMNGGNMITDRTGSPFSTTSPFGIPCTSPSTPIFSSPATQFAPTTSASPGIFKFGEQNAPSGEFSIGPSGGNDNLAENLLESRERNRLTLCYFGGGHPEL